MLLNLYRTFWREVMYPQPKQEGDLGWLVQLFQK